MDKLPPRSRIGNTDWDERDRIEQVRRGLAEAEPGEVVDHETVMAEVRAKIERALKRSD